jgi:peptidoglycan/LPS O-acetylase OafA/YrhL
VDRHARDVHVVQADLAAVGPDQAHHHVEAGGLAYPVWFLLAAALVLAVNTIFPLPLLEPLALATVVVFFALFLYVGNFAKYGDFSYGVYIIHFPVIQLLVQGDWLRDRPGWFLATLILLTGMGALAMWHLVEKRFLLRSSHYLAGDSLAATAASDPTPDQGAPVR